MKVSVAAFGSIKEYIPEAGEVELEEPVCLSEFKVIAGIPATVPVSYIVNGNVQNGKYTVQENDAVKLIMIVGGG